jgi:hypothetical protein
MPLASIFRIRANHEYPMLACLLFAIIGADLVRRSWRWIWVMPLALVSALLVKGVFVMVPLIAVGFWVLINPRQEPNTVWRPILAVLASLGTMAVVAVAYDAAYLRVTGEAFWAPYWERQLAPLTIATPGDGGSTLVGHATFYAIRILWHPAPWSWCLLLAAWKYRTRVNGIWRTWTERERRAFLAVLLTASSIVLMLIPASRFAERYIFAANHLFAAAGIVVALRVWPAFARQVAEWDARLPGLPALVWTTLMFARLVVGPYLPRISG